MSLRYEHPAQSTANIEFQPRTQPAQAMHWLHKSIVATQLGTVVSRAGFELSNLLAEPVLLDGLARQGADLENHGLARRLALPAPPGTLLGQLSGVIGTDADREFIFADRRLTFDLAPYGVDRVEVVGDA